MQTERRVAANPKTKPIDLDCESTENWQLPSTCTIAIVIITKPVSWYWFYCPTEGVRLSRPGNCSKGAQLVHKAVYCSLIWSLAVLNPRVGHTMDVLSPFIPVLCHSDWLFHGESCPRGVQNKIGSEPLTQSVLAQLPHKKVKILKFRALRAFWGCCSPWPLGGIFF